MSRYLQYRGCGADGVRACRHAPHVARGSGRIPRQELSSIFMLVQPVILYAIRPWCIPVRVAPVQHGSLGCVSLKGACRPPRVSAGRAGSGDRARVLSRPGLVPALSRDENKPGLEIFSGFSGNRRS